MSIHMDRNVSHMVVTGYAVASSTACETGRWLIYMTSTINWDSNCELEPSRCLASDVTLVAILVDLFKNCFVNVFMA